MQILALIGMVIAGIGGLWLLVVAFKESVLWGLGCLFIPFVSLFFVVKHWPDAGKPFLVSLAGSAVMVVGILISGGLQPA